MMAGCGSTPAAPATPVAVALAPGAYSLVVRSAGSGCFSISVGGAPAPDANISLNATVSSAANGWTAVLAPPATGTLRVDLTRAAGDVSGQMTGTGSDGQKSLTLAHAVRGSATARPNEIEGRITGSVSFESTNGSATICSDPAWTLAPR